MTEEMNVEEALKLLADALKLQMRSPLQYTLFSASMSGFQVQAVASKLWSFASEELDDTRKLVEKMTALGGEPTTQQAPLRWAKAPEGVIDVLIETETEVVEALHAVMPATGQEMRGGPRASLGAHHHAQTEPDRLPPESPRLGLTGRLL
ncbi:hypothetical protein BH24ACT26_BH24ACT26_13250 [soil metagenome]